MADSERKIKRVTSPKQKKAEKKFGPQLTAIAMKIQRVKVNFLRKHLPYSDKAILK